MRRLRGPLIALVAAVLELVIVAAVGNQWVTKRALENTTKSQVGDAITHSATAFGWRFNPQGGNHSLWAGQLIGVGVLVVLVFLFVLALTTRSSRSFLGTFVGVWGGTVLAALLAGAVRQFIAFPDLFPGGRDDAGLGRWANALTSGPSSGVAIFGVTSGFVVALVTAIIASATARTITPPAAPAAEPAEEPAWSPETAAPWGAEYGQPAEGGPARPGDTAQLPQEPYSASTGNPELAQYATERTPTVARPDEPTVAGEAQTTELSPPESAETAETAQLPPAESEPERPERG
jgi:hypothetical protein